jgi:hypothetical protein
MSTLFTTNLWSCLTSGISHTPHATIAGTIKNKENGILQDMLVGIVEVRFVTQLITSPPTWYLLSDAVTYSLEMVTQTFTLSQYSPTIEPRYFGGENSARAVGTTANSIPRYTS